MRLAVITPFFKTPHAWLQQCLDSVARQTLPCTHFLVCDGDSPAEVTLAKDVQVLQLPQAHHDVGNAARAIGSISAICHGFDAITYLDADNWYDLHHVEQLWLAHERTQSAVCTSGRNLVDLEGNLLGPCPEVDGESFVDTNCLFLARPAFGIISAWYMMARSQVTYGDRVVWRAIQDAGLSRTQLPERTVWYRTNYAAHYRYFGKEPPMGAKPSIQVDDTSLPVFAGCSPRVSGPARSPSETSSALGEDTPNRASQGAPPYTKDFFLSIRTGSRRSANIVVPLVMDVLKPQSVIDIGCGVGTWLAAFAERGVDNILGVDGSYVDQSLLEIPAKFFQPHDLRQPFSSKDRFDLALSLEVGEHLELAAAPVLIDTLVHLAPAVLFSAAIPLQGGTGHVNEQWPDFWVNLFDQRGFQVIDCLRPEIWNNNEVDWWYSQNLLLFVNSDYLASQPHLQRALAQTRKKQLAVVHPQRYVDLANALITVLSKNPAARATPTAPVFQSDWFSSHIPQWTQFLQFLKGQPVQALEIGVFEGRSAVWLLENVLTHPHARLTWIDPFASDPAYPEYSMDIVERRFRSNTQHWRQKLIDMKGRSEEMLRRLPFASFDFIYIDGSHVAPDVLTDAVLAWPLLKPGGLLAFDDYQWTGDPDPRRNPKLAIDAFNTVFAGKFEVLHHGYQVWLRKKG